MIRQYRISVTIFVILSIVLSNASSKKSASIYRIMPSTEEDLKILLNLTIDLNETMYWNDPTNVNVTADLMVPRKQNSEFRKLMKRNKLKYYTLTSDVQELLNNASTNSIPNKMKRARSIRHRSFQSNLDWTRFHNLAEIYTWLDSLARAHPRNVRTIVAGHSYEGRAIKGVHIKFGKGRPGVFVEAGIHAREWLSHATAAFLINQLLRSGNPEVRWLAESFDWYIFPCVNPDGYVFTHINPRDSNYRLWRKTRSPNVSKGCVGTRNCVQQTCYGTDLNRNWNANWGGAGSGHYACGEVFAGTNAFSEVETLTLAQYISTIAHKLFAYISFHSYVQKLMFPYGHTAQHLDNYKDQYDVGLRAVYALYRRYGTRYQLGNIAELLGSASGGSIDWVKATYKIPFVYCYELRGRTNSNQFYGFVPPPSEIIPNGIEVVDSLVALFRAASQYNYPQLRRNYSNSQ